MWPLSSLGDWSVQGVANIYITDRLNYLALRLLLLNIGRPRKEKMFRFSICDVRQFISRRTFCQPLSSPLLCSLWWCLPQFSCLSLASFLLSLLCLPAFCFLLLLCIHGCFHISVCYLSFTSFPLPPSCLLLSCLFLYIICWHNAFVSFSLCVSFVFVFCFVFSFHVSSWFPPGCSVRFILAVYFLSLKPWRWIIEQTDPRVLSCYWGGMCVCVFVLV